MWAPGTLVTLKRGSYYVLGLSRYEKRQVLCTVISSIATFPGGDARSVETTPWCVTLLAESTLKIINMWSGELLNNFYVTLETK